MTSLTLYLLIVIGNIGKVSGVLFIVGGTCALVAGIIITVEELWNGGNVYKHFKKGIITLIIVGIIAILTPSTKEMAAIYLIPKIVNSEQIANIPDNIAKLADDWIEEFKPKKGK